ncbi:MAG TPA: hypothetical protein VF185_00875 [Patescibacteria group bacterium]
MIETDARVRTSVMCELRWKKISPLLENGMFVERELLTTFREVIEKDIKKIKGVSYEVLGDTLLNGDKSLDHQHWVGIRLKGISNLDQYDRFWSEVRKIRKLRRG